LVLLREIEIVSGASYGVRRQASLAEKKYAGVGHVRKVIADLSGNIQLRPGH